ncbi:MAG: thioredoxin family protein [Bacteroidales bacterium]|nr:thioredoxin family protein [Bacteroidales bacterium]
MSQIQNHWQLFYFTGPGCQVCKVLEPQVRLMMADEFPQVEYRLIDVSNEMEVAAHHSVFTVPAIILLHESREYLREIRFVSVPQLRQKISRLIALSQQE